MKTPLSQCQAKTVPDALDGAALDAAVRALFEVSWGKARAWIEEGKIAVDDTVALDPTARVAVGDEVRLSMNAPRPRGRSRLDRAALVHVDAHVVVVDKPAGVSTVPYDDDETDTLDRRVRDALGDRSLGIVHRIDKETSGLVVFTRTWLAKTSLAAQFRAHTTHRRYLALVHGRARSATFVSHLVENRGDGLRGSLEAKRRGRGAPLAAAEAARLGGRRAVTHVEALEDLDGATLVACRLETGRTHQIRIHLSEAGHPLVGERVYTRGFAGPILAAPRLMLHAAELGFVHPKTEVEARFQRDPPADFAAVLRRLRGAP